MTKFLGIYTLTQDVKNPKPDKRMAGDWRATPIWTKGMRFVIEEHSDENSEYVFRTMYKLHTYQTIASTHESGRYGAIFSWLEKESDSVDSVFVEMGFRDRHCEELLTKMVKMDMICLGNLRSAIEKVKEDWGND